MSKTLQLLRHAKSDWDNPALQDEKRPLSKRGRKDIALMAERAEADGLCKGLQLVVCSPTLRTRETLEGFSDALPKSVATKFDHHIYGASVKALYDVVQGLPENADHVLLVGHNPGFYMFALDLADPKRSPNEHYDELINKYPTAALATLELKGKWRDANRGSAALTGFLPPRELR